MIIRSVFLLSFCAVASAQFDLANQPNPNHPPCSVCGSGRRVGNLDVTWVPPGFDPLSCGLLQRAGLEGFIDPSLCGIVPSLIGICECVDGEATLEPSPTKSPTKSPMRTPTRTPTKSPVASPGSGCEIVIPPESPGFEACSICGVGQKVTNMEGMFVAPGRDPTPCVLTQDGGLTGFIAPGFCPLVTQFAGDCGCAPGEAVLSTCNTQAPGTPSPTGTPTRTPTRTPTKSPVASPGSGCEIIIPPESPGFEPCSICGVGQKVTNVEGMFVAPGRDPTPCILTQDGGLTGFIDPGICPVVAQFAGDCGCAPGEAVLSTCNTQAPGTPSPAGTPTKSPVASPGSGCEIVIPPESPGFEPCSICGLGQKVTNMEGMFVAPGRDPTPCVLTQDGGLTGFIAPGFCPLVTQFAGDCGCAPGEAVLSTCNTQAPGTLVTAPPVPQPAPAPGPAPGCEIIIPPESPGHAPCSICGEGLRVTKPDGLYRAPGRTPTRCDTTQDGGLVGFIDPLFCPLVSQYAGECDCAPGEAVLSTCTTGSPDLPPGCEIIIPPESPGHAPCSICGEGLRVTKPDGLYRAPGRTPTRCDTTQDGGLVGFIDPLFCPLVSQYAGECDCAPGEAVLSTCTTGGTGVPAPLPINPPGSPSPTDTNPPCNVCGDGKQVGDPDAELDFDFIPEATCGDLEMGGVIGTIPVLFCSEFPSLIGDLCKCEDIPSPTSPPTRRPTRAPTPPPTRPPTPPPTRRPTRQPTRPPTRAPTPRPSFNIRDFFFITAAPRPISPPPPTPFIIPVFPPGTPPPPLFINPFFPAPGSFFQPPAPAPLFIKQTFFPVAERSSRTMGMKNRRRRLRLKS